MGAPSCAWRGHVSAEQAILMLRMARLEERSPDGHHSIDTAILDLAVKAGRRDLIPPALESRARREEILP